MVRLACLVEVEERGLHVPSQILALPQPVGPAGAATAVGVRLEVRAPERVRNAVVAPLSPRRYEIRVTIDEATDARCEVTGGASRGRRRGSRRARRPVAA